MGTTLSAPSRRRRTMVLQPNKNILSTRKTRVGIRRRIRVRFISRKGHNHVTLAPPYTMVVKIYTPILKFPITPLGNQHTKKKEKKTTDMLPEETGGRGPSITN